jgi:hypothetical protein
MYQKRVIIRGDYWSDVALSYKQPSYYEGTVVSRNSYINKKGEVVWDVEIDDWKIEAIPEDELSLTISGLFKVINAKKKQIHNDIKPSYNEVENVKIQNIRNIEKLTKDRTWKQECETVNETGMRKGYLCNGKFHAFRNGRKICGIHYKRFIDTLDGESERSVDEDESDSDLQSFIENDDENQLKENENYEKSDDDNFEMEDDIEKRKRCEDFENSDNDDEDIRKKIFKRRRLPSEESEEYKESRKDEEYKEDEEDVKRNELYIHLPNNGEHHFYFDELRERCNIHFVGK